MKNNQGRAYVETAPTPCPYCHEPNDCHTCDGTMPHPGDTSMCWQCGLVGIFALDPLGRLIVRLPTEQESATIQDDPEYRALRTARMVSQGPLSAKFKAQQYLRNEGRFI